jgi:Tfp pilus assembly protein PilO
MRKQSSVALFFVMPLVVFFWILGWSFYWIGSSKKLTEAEKRNSSKDLAFTVLVPEQEYAR